MINTLPKTRKEAIDSNLPQYFTGKPCRNGHICARYASGHCTQCSSDKSVHWQKQNWGRVVQTHKKWVENNQDKVKATQLRYRQTHVDEEKLRRINSADYMKVYSKHYRKINRNKLNAYEATRRAAKLNATPSWSEKESITHFYEAAPTGYEVDHIIPLKHKLVCGLHVLANLQYLTRKDNIAKLNSFVPYYQKPNEPAIAVS